MVTFTVGSNSLGPLAVGAGNATVDSLGFVAASVSINYTPMAAGNLAVNATFTPGSSNFAQSSITSGATVNAQNNEGFTLTPSTPPNCSNASTGSCIFIAAVGKSATSPVTVTSIGLNGTVTLTCAVTPTNPADLQIPGCSFTLNGAANSTVSLNGSGSSGQRMLTIATTAASVVAAPARLPQGDYWIFASGTLSVVGFWFLLLDVRERRPRLAAVFALLLVLAAGAAIGCGSSNPGGTTTSGSTSGSGAGGSGSGGQTSQPGTTADIYTVTVTATPSAGASIQTQFQVFVQ